MTTTIALMMTVIDTALGIIGLLMILRLLLQIFKVGPQSPVLKLLRTVTDPILTWTNKLLGIPTYRYTIPTLQSDLLSIIATLILVWAGRTLLVWVLNLVASIPLWVANPLSSIAGVVYSLLGLAFELYELAIFVRILFGWIRVPYSSKIMNFLYRITEPLLAPLRSAIPPFGGLDFSPILAYFLLRILRTVVFSFLGWIF